MNNMQKTNIEMHKIIICVITAVVVISCRDFSLGTYYADKSNDY